MATVHYYHLVVTDSTVKVCSTAIKLLQIVGWLTVRVSLSSLSGAVLTNTDVIIPTISGEGTVFSAITCGFSKYLAWWEKKETVVTGSTGNTDTGGKEERQRGEENGKLLSASSKNSATCCGGCTYNNFRKVFVNLLHKVQKVMNLRREDYGKHVNKREMFKCSLSFS